MIHGPTKDRYNARHYDRIGLVVPKGGKAALQALAAAAGVSVNRYILQAVETVSGVRLALGDDLPAVAAARSAARSTTGGVSVAGVQSDSGFNGAGAADLLVVGADTTDAGKAIQRHGNADCGDFSAEQNSDEQNTPGAEQRDN